MSVSASSSSSLSRIYAQPLEDVVRVATLGRAAFGANLAKVSSLLKSDGFVSVTSNAVETTCVGSSELIVAHFAGPSASSEVSISHAWRVFRVDQDGEWQGSEDDGADGGTLGEVSVVENVSDRLGKAGISCYYTASIEADFVLVSVDDYDRACGILLDNKVDSITYADVFAADTVEIVPGLGSDEEVPLGTASTLDAGPFSTANLDITPADHSLSRKRSCPEIGFFDVTGRSFGPSPPCSPSAASFSSMATDSPTFETLKLPDAYPVQFQPSDISSRRNRRASSSAATALFSITPRHASPAVTPSPIVPGVTVHLSQLSMIKLQPSSSRRRDTALDSVQLYLNDIAEDDLLSLALGQASFFSLVKDQGSFSVTGDPLMMGKRFDEVTEDVLREARRAIEEQDAEDAHKAASLADGSRAHRRTRSCPPAGAPIGSPGSLFPRDFDWTVQYSPDMDGEDSSDLVHEETGTILRALQVRLPPDEGFRKSGILRKYSNLLSVNSIPMVYHSTASFANILVPKKDLALARQILEQA